MVLAWQPLEALRQPLPLAELEEEQFVSLRNSVPYRSFRIVISFDSSTSCSFDLPVPTAVGPVTGTVSPDESLIDPSLIF